MDRVKKLVKEITHLFTFLLLPGSNIALCLHIASHPQNDWASQNRWHSKSPRALYELLTNSRLVLIQRNSREPNERTMVGESAGIAKIWWAGRSTGGALGGGAGAALGCCFGGDDWGAGLAPPPLPPPSLKLANLPIFSSLSACIQNRGLISVSLLPSPALPHSQ